MNIQAERLENQTARLTIEVEPERLENAKQAAARKISKQVRIPGFRKGKVPYRILLQNGLEPQILSEAIDELSQEIYREAITQSEYEPYGPGSFEDFTLEPPTFIYTVPLQPVVDLKGYRDVRVDYESPEVSQADVERALMRLRDQAAEAEDSDVPAALGNRLTVDIHSEYADDPPENQTEEETERLPQRGEEFIHQHDAVFRLDPDDEPLLPGLNQAMLGAVAGAEIEFELTIPEDAKDFSKGDHGRKIKFHVHVKKIEHVKLPELNDEFAAKLSEGESEPLTLDGLRERVREDLLKQLEAATKSRYSTQVVDEMVKAADIQYPEAMVEDQITAMIEDFEERLKQQRMTLETYYKLTGISEQELRDQQREMAEASLRRGLVLREVVAQNNLTVLDEQVEVKLNNVMRQFGAGASGLRSMFDTPQMRSMMANDLSTELALDFVSKIGRGEDVSNFMDEVKLQAQQAIAEYKVELAAMEAESEQERAVEDSVSDAETVDDQVIGDVEGQTAADTGESDELAEDESQM